MLLDNEEFKYEAVQSCRYKDKSAEGFQLAIVHAYAAESVNLDGWYDVRKGCFASAFC